MVASIDCWLPNWQSSSTNLDMLLGDSATNLPQFSRWMKKSIVVPTLGLIRMMPCVVAVAAEGVLTAMHRVSSETTA